VKGRRIFEKSVFKSPPFLNLGGYLDRRGRGWALRMADECTARPDGTWLVRRSWWKGKFSEDYYRKDNR
jgi:hypothetical protein